MALATKPRTPVKRAKKSPSRSTRTTSAVKFTGDGKIKLATIRAVDVKYMGEEPTWENQDQMTDEELDSKKARAFNWYNYSCDRKEAKEFFETWCKVTPGYEEYPKKFKALPDWRISSTMGWLCRMYLVGLKMRDKEKDLSFINAQIAQCEEHLKQMPITNDKPEVRKETIQDRLLEKYHEIMGDIEGAVDDFLESKTPFDTYKHLQATGLPVQFVSKIPDFFQPKINEMTEFLAGTCPQLNEGYKHLGKKGAKELIKFYQSIIEGAQAYKGLKVATRAKPKRKPIPPEKVIRKLNYMKAFPELGLTSIDPKDIIGCTELWVYNTKTRKLGRFHATMHGDMVVASLSVKNSSIVNFSETLSVCKTLRKPKEVMDKFKVSGKPQLRKFLDSIRSVETKMKPRISAETILLRAVK